MKDHIIFDTTDADTIADSDKILSGIISSDGSTLITDTTVGGDQGLDVYVINSDLTVSANAEKAEDAAHTTGDTGNFVLAVANHTEGALHSADGDYAALQVDDVGRLRVIADIDVGSADADKDEDTAHASGDTGSYVLAVRQDSLASSTSTDGDYGSFKTNAKGELYTIDTDGNALLTTIDGVLDSIKLDTAAMVVDLAAIEVEQLAQGVTLDAILVDTSAMVVDLAAIEVEQLAQGVTLDSIETDTGSIDSTLTALSKAEDSVHASGDQGIMGLAVRNDTLAALAGTDGDYAPLQVNAVGALYVKHDGDLDVSDVANTAIANAANTLAVAATAEDVVASPLTDRKNLFIYNNDNRQMFVGASGVTAANGFPVSPGSYLELKAGAAIDIEYVSPKVGHEIRTMELS